MNFTPIRGQAALQSLLASGLIVQSVSSGSYLFTGPIWILTAHASIRSGVDAWCSWADATDIVWRYLNVPSGASYTVVTSGKSYLASPNPFMLIADGDQWAFANSVAQPSTPPWAQTMQLSVMYGNLTLYSNNVVALSPLMFDNSNGSPSDPSFGFEIFTPCTSDVMYDSFAPFYTTSATCPQVWNIASGAAVSTNLYTLADIAFEGTTILGCDLMGVGEDLATNAILNYNMYLFLVDAGFVPVAGLSSYGLTALQNHVIAAIQLGPFLTCSSLNVPALGGSAPLQLAAAVPGWLDSTTSSGFYRNGARVMAGCLGATAAAPTLYTNPGNLVYLSSPCKFGRTSQVLLGNAQRTT